LHDRKLLAEVQPNESTSKGTMEENVIAALALAKEGFHVFPVYEPKGSSGSCSCSKGHDCRTPGKHPRSRNGFNSATRDPKKIKRAWEQHPTANVGIATGEKSGVTVIDVDYDRGGQESLKRLLVEVGEEWPQTLSVTTGNGAHHYLRHLPGLKCGTNVLGPGIDVRSEGGFVVAPPSLHSSGKRYEFVDRNAPILEIPSWLCERLGERRTTGHDPGTEIILTGSRNELLTQYAGELRAAGADEEHIFIELRAFNLDRCQPPLSDQEVRAIAASVAKYDTGPAKLIDDGEPLASGNPLWFLQFDLGRWNESIPVSLMDAKQAGMHILLLFRSWPERGRLPADSAILAKLARADSVEDFESSAGLVLDGFEPRVIHGRNMIVHRGLEALYAEKLAVWRHNQFAGQRSGEARRRKKQEQEDAGF